MKYKAYTGPQVEIAMTEEVGRLRGGVTKEGSDRAAKIYTFEKEVPSHSVDYTCFFRSEFWGVT